MATCRNFDDTVVDSADDDNENQQNASTEAERGIVIKYTCNPCKESKTFKEAPYHCFECHDIYNEECYQFDKRMAKLKDHVVYRKSDEDKCEQKASSAQLNEKCTKHPSEIISIHCETCNELCCHICISLKHSICFAKKYIPSAAKGIIEGTKMQKTKEHVKRVYDKAEQYKNTNENSIHDIYMKQEISLQEIADMRKQVNDVFNEMEERATLGVSHFGNTLSVNMKEEIDVCNAIKQEMDPLLEKLENRDDKDECLAFMDVVKVQNSLGKAEAKIKKLLLSENTANVVDGFYFASNTNINQMLQEIKSFGQVSCRYIIARSRARCPHDSQTHIDAFIEGICQLNDGTFILADSANVCLTWLSSTYNVKGNAALDEIPTAVCNTETNHVAVSLKKQLKVFLIDKEISGVQSKDLKFSHRCCGLAYKDRKYFISDNLSTVYVYDINGICQKKIKTERGCNIFQSVRNIAVGDRANKIYVTDTDNGLITLDLKGKVLSTLDSKETKGSYGVCVTNDGRVIVTNYLQDNVIEVDENGQAILQKNFITLSADQSPMSICYDSKNACVLVSENPIGGSRLLSVFQI